MSYSSEFGKDFQRHLLAVLLRTPGALLRYRTALEVEYFGPDKYRSVAKVLFALIDKYRELPTAATFTQALRDELNEDDFESISRLVAKLWKEDVGDAAAVMNRVVQFGKQHALENAVLESARLLKQEKDQQARIRPLIDAAMQVGEDLSSTGIEWTAATQHEREQWYARQRAAEAIPTGLDVLDYALGGGLCRGELGMLLAGGKVGKTTTLVGFGVGALETAIHNPVNVVHYSLEMLEHKVAMRYDDRLSRESHKYKHKDVLKYIRRLEARSREYLNGRLIVKGYPTRTASVDTLRAHLYLLDSLGIKPDLVIVDYAMIMKPARRMGERRHEIAGVYEDLRGLGGELNCGVWTAHQATRAAMSKERLDMRDLGESFEPAHVMDVGLALMQTDEERDDDRCSIYLMGVRDVEDHRTVECTIDRARALITPVRLVGINGEQIETPYDRVEDPSASQAAKTVRRLAMVGEQEPTVTVPKKGTVKKKILKKRIADNE